MKWRFRRHDRHEREFGRKRHMPFFCILLMAVGALTLLYLVVVYLLMPVLAMLTVS